MLVLLETGMRPGEARALRWREYYGEERAFVVRHGVESGTKDKIKGTKTDQVKAAAVSVRTSQELTIWRMETKFKANDDFIFTLDGARPVTNLEVLKAFRAGMETAGLDSAKWVPYTLRHTFITYSIPVLDDWELEMMAGHSTLRTSLKYRHPDDEIVLARSRLAREKLDKAREK
jgi:integrase